ncbi:MAG: tRNA (guanosine(46)-N7)-methyltransferase TrmB [Campylobacteraceae bacterium]|nr:tRNA (guanosine(46)-N7)-methyltransferase TrmB [Campylobacteraceae bacterium]
MPHIIYKKNNILETPSQCEDTVFDFLAKSYNFNNENRIPEYKVALKRDGVECLLTIKSKDDNFMVKADNITRLTPVSLVKDALNDFATITKAEILSSNTASNGEKIDPKKEYLKDINYFVNDFNTDKEIYIEIGFGSGRHLIHQAEKNPDIQFIGLEIHTPSIEQMLKQVEIKGIKNILAVSYDARLFMEFINSNRVGKIFVHFPVPWDKKPHRRIYSNEFINEALRVLKIDGKLELRTDSRKYFDYCTDLLTNLPTGKITIDINKDLEVISKYEDRWRKQGKNIYDVVLTNYANDEDINLNHDFSFDKNINLDKFLKNMDRKAEVNEDYFVHLEDAYVINEKTVLLKLTFGSFNKPLSKYILINETEIRYFQGNPLPTSANIKAHTRIQELLK